MNVKLIQTGLAAFQTRWDLVQALYSNLQLPVGSEYDPGESQSMMAGYGGGAQGSDHNYDATISTADSDAFLTDYFDQRTAADLNNDGTVDSDDVVKFVQGL